MSEPQPEYERLLDAILEDRADEALRLRFRQLLQEQPALRDDYLLQMRAHVLLQCRGGTVQSADVATRSPGLSRKGAAWPARRLAAAAAVLLIGLGYALYRMNGGTVLATIESAAAASVVQADGERVPAQAGMALQAGDALRVGASGSALILCPGEPTRIRLGEKTDVRFPPGAPGLRIGLDAGTLHADVAPQPPGRPMVLVTPHAEARVLGTRLALAAGPRATLLEVDEGRVSLARAGDAAAAEVASGQFAVAAPDAPPAPRPRPADPDSLMRRILDGASGRDCLVAAPFAGPAPDAEALKAWKPAAAPLMTRWGRELDPARALPDYPRPQMVRPRWLNLNGLWDYAITRKDDGAPRSYAGKILVPFPIESALSGVRKSLDGNSRLWYRRSFDVPADYAGSRLLLHFDAVDWEATVLVNGREAGRHRGGFDRFTFDITDALKAGGSQELVVSVWDPSGGPLVNKGKQTCGSLDALGGLGYTACSGIWRTVWLEPVPAASIERLVITPDVDKGRVHVAVLGRGEALDGDVEVAVLDGAKEVASARGKPGAPLSLALPGAKRWTPDTPFLYDLKATLKAGAKGTDSVGGYFGMRKVSLGKDDKGAVLILLNDEPVFQVGPLDQGYWPDGIYTAPSDEALKYDVEITKRLGCNVSRKHVKVEPDRWYHWCDKLGLLVWQDMPSGQAGKGGDQRASDEAAAQFETDLKAMIDGLYNHPSVIMWILFNEEWGQFDTVRLTAWTKAHDPTRLVSAVSCGKTWDAGDILDDHPYWIPRAMKPDGKRALVLGEFGGRAMVVPGHVVTEKDVWGHPGGTVLASPWELTTHYTRLMRHVFAEKEAKGLCGAIYTQLTDVERECNGMVTYDRAVVKVDLAKMAAVFQGRLPPEPAFRALSPVADKKSPVTWRYTTERPADDWFTPGFDASAWKEGPSAFGASPREQTAWKTPHIWIRRELEIGDGTLMMPQLLAHHALGTEIYLNGILAATLTGYTIEYQEYEIRPEARASLKPGKNVIAAHGFHNGKEQLLDVGVVDPLPSGSR